MNKETLLESLSLDEKFVECIYVFDSRAYGTASRKRQSDYDIVIVLKSNAWDQHPNLQWSSLDFMFNHHWINPTFRYLFSDETDKKCFVDLGDREAQMWMFNIETFRQLLKTNTMFAIECIFLPEDLKWIEKIPFYEEFQVNNSMLEQSVMNHSRSHLFMSAKNLTEVLFPNENTDLETENILKEMSNDCLWDRTPLPRQYNFYKTKKLLWHSIRLIYFGIQVKSFGRINDFAQANYLYEDLIAIESHRWIDFHQKYIELYNELINQFLHK